MPESFEVLVTERLRLRRVTEADLDAVIAISTDPLTNQHRPGGAPTAEQCRAMCGRFMRDWEIHGIGYWVVQYAGELVGIAGVMPVDLEGNAYWNLYFRFSPAVWGKGVAAEATRAAIAAAGRHTLGRPVIARTRATNTSAIALALALGMRRAAELDMGGLIAYETS